MDKGRYLALLRSTSRGTGFCLSWEGLLKGFAQRLAEEHFRLCPAINVRRVEQGDPRIDGRVDHALSLVLVDAHPEIVAAQAHHADLEA